MATKPRLVLRRNLKPAPAPPSKAQKRPTVGKHIRALDVDGIRSPRGRASTSTAAYIRAIPTPAPAGYVFVFRFDQLPPETTFTHFGFTDLCEKFSTMEYLRLPDREYPWLIVGPTRVCVDEETYCVMLMANVHCLGAVEQTGSMRRAPIPSVGVTVARGGA